MTGVLYIAVQLLGAWAAYGLFTYIVNNSLPNPNAHYSSRVLVTEVVGTAIFAFGWAAALYQGYTRAVTAAVAGLSYMVGIVTVSVLTIGFLNPALALGARSWVWGTYVLGPVLGAVIGTNLYSLIFSEAEKVVVATSSSTTQSATRAAIVKPARKTTAKKKTTRGRK